MVHLVHLVGTTLYIYSAGARGAPTTNSLRSRKVHLVHLVGTTLILKTAGAPGAFGLRDPLKGAPHCPIGGVGEKKVHFFCGCTGCRASLTGPAKLTWGTSSSKTPWRKAYI